MARHLEELLVNRAASRWLAHRTLFATTAARRPRKGRGAHDSGTLLQMRYTRRTRSIFPARLPPLMALGLGIENLRIGGSIPSLGTVSAEIRRAPTRPSA